MQIDNTTEVRVEDLKSFAFLWFEDSVVEIRELLDGVTAARNEYARRQPATHARAGTGH